MIFSPFYFLLCKILQASGLPDIYTYIFWCTNFLYIILIQQAHRIIDACIIIYLKNINVIGNLIDVSLTTNHFPHIEIHYLSQIMVLHHFIFIIISINLFLVVFTNYGLAFGHFWSNSIHFDLYSLHRPNSVHFGLHWSNSVPFGLIWSIQFTSI